MRFLVETSIPAYNFSYLESSHKGRILMFTIWGKSRGYCDGVSRRDFLRIGALGAGLTLSDMLRLQSQAANVKGAVKSQTSKGIILVYLPGGPSHMDMYDLKPEAPAEYRGEFKPTATNVPGMEICELMPRQAQIADKLAIIRSITGVFDEHSDAQASSGWGERENRNVGRPSLGAVVSKMRGSDNPEIPPFVSLRGQTFGLEPGYLGKQHRAFTPDGPGMSNLKLHGAVSSKQLDDRRTLLGAFDQMRRDVDASGTMNGIDAYTTRAFDIITSGTIRNALDLTKEDPRTRDRYGKISQFLTARRLIEAGVGCVTLSYGGWDTHSDNFKTLRTQLPELDTGLSALIEDLHIRGLNNDVSVVMWGEFGRTPRVNGTMGRDHWAPAMSCLLAGGGFRTGQVIGSTNSKGEVPKDRPVSIQNIFASLYRALGIDPDLTFQDGSGRPMHLLNDRLGVPELNA
jgi:hypothetical protein